MGEGEGEGDYKYILPALIVSHDLEVECIVSTTGLGRNPDIDTFRTHDSYRRR